MMKLALSSATILITSFLLHCLTARSADWPNYRGPGQMGISTENIDIPWNGDGPKTLWRTPTNTGFSSFAVAGGRAFTQVIRDLDGKSREICLALDAKTGKEVWFADLSRGEYDGGGDTAGGGDGPRSTPTVSDGKVYLLTPDLVVHCLDAADGAPVWKHSLMREHHGRNIGWKS